MLNTDHYRSAWFFKENCVVEPDVCHLADSSFFRWYNNHIWHLAWMILVGVIQRMYILLKLICLGEYIAITTHSLINIVIYTNLVQYLIQTSNSGISSWWHYNMVEWQWLQWCSSYNRSICVISLSIQHWAIAQCCMDSSITQHLLYALLWRIKFLYTLKIK